MKMGLRQSGCEVSAKHQLLF